MLGRAGILDAPPVSLSTVTNAANTVYSNNAAGYLTIIRHLFTVVDGNEDADGYGPC